ncbi:MAG: pyruvate, phosphate dikinase, partial [Alphaproteobacteria bacterium]
GGATLPKGLKEQVDDAIHRLEKATGKRFAGNEGTPLLVSVRSGAKISMPGMMDTILNLGLDANSVARLAAITNDMAFAVDSWARFWSMYADIVLGLDSLLIEEETEGPRKEAAEKGTPEALKAFENAVLASIQGQGEEAPIEPRAQLDHAIAAVFNSWDSPRAKTYRKHHGIPDDLGTAVTVQTMVFGNLNQNSGSGVAFTRNPITGVHELYGEYLRGGQGEEVVAGTTTPASISDPDAMGEALTKELIDFGTTLESLYRDALDIEFTVEDGKLYMLQVRPAKRTSEAAVSIATQLVSDKVISEGEALQRVTVEQVKRLLRPKFDPDALKKAKGLAKGIGASPGHASGVAVLDSDRAAERAATGEDVILLRPTTSPLDVRGMLASQGIVTGRGGSASHAAVVSRALDKPCVVGCSDIDIDPDAKTFKTNGQAFSEGDPLSIDGETGAIYAGVIPLRGGGVEGGALANLLEWADKAAKAKVWIAAKNTAEANSAAERKSAGIGVVPLTELLVS